MMQTAATGSDHIKNYIFGSLLTLVVYLSKFYSFLKISYFFKISLLASLKILCSEPLNLLKEVTNKIFVTHQKFSKTFHNPSIYA